MNVKQTIMVTLTEAEARDYCAEVAELDTVSVITRTGLTTIRRLRNELSARGLGS
jgi:hypothetical protein